MGLTRDSLDNFYDMLAVRLISGGCLSNDTGDIGFGSHASFIAEARMSNGVESHGVCLQSFNVSVQ